ncbi:MerR family transcriptional regulator [Paenibacillus sp. AK121]|uniref:MerR family transcriptional regulator n=1 Tax=Paenibacillus TaxID=44249 RepID=UPI001C2168F1|nr:MerR family transcriptional regulator [Paenibacillus sp. AK121]MBU9708618.1 MerR family transcriptional regulator [Paenibacillus sp. AK121]MEE4569950.1 MerR family transcriptional regulator [Paenibacillus polymyxa]
MTTTFKMKELMEQLQVSEDTLRYYEKIGLLPPVARKNNGHRIYNNSHKEALLMIRCLKKAGMSLQELKPIIQLQLDESSISDIKWYDRLYDYQKKIDQQMQELQEIKDMIELKLLTGQKFGHNFLPLES